MSGELEQPDRGDIDLATVLAALADPYRLEIVRKLARHGEMSCVELQKRIPIEVTKSTGSHHLRVLREAGITSARVSGVYRYSMLRRADLDARFPGLLGAIMASSTEAASA